MKDSTINYAGMLTRTYESGSAYAYGPAGAYGMLPPDSIEIVQSTFHTNVASQQPNVMGDKVLPNPYWFSKQDWSCYQGTEICRSYGSVGIPGGGTYKGLLSTTTLSGSFGEAPSHLDNFPDDQSYNACLSKVYGRLRGNLDLSVAAAEFSRTYSMTKKAVKLARYVLEMHPRHWAKHYLEYKFGWYPLAMDLYGTAKAITSQSNQAIRIREQATITDFRRKVTNSTYFRTVTETTLSRRTQIGLVYLPSSATIEKIAGFASMDPASIAWELTPFSFIVDYVYDIGSYLRNLESSRVLTGGLQHGYVTQSSKIATTSVIAGNGKRVGGISYSGTREGTSEDKMMSRTMLLNMPQPGLPVFSLGLGSTQLFNVAAVLSTFLDLEAPPDKRARRILNSTLDRQLSDLQNGYRRIKDSWQHFAH